MVKKLGLYLLLILYPLVLAGSGCADASSKESGASKAAPDFTLRDTNGQEITLSRFRGQNTLLVFGATWCPHCIAEIPELKEIYNTYNDRRIKLIYIDVQESERKVSSFIKKHAIPYTVLLDITGSTARRFEVRGIPHQVIIDKNGLIYYEGPRPINGIKPLLSEFMKKRNNGGI